MTLILMDSSSNKWVELHGTNVDEAAGPGGGGIKSLSGELTQIRLAATGAGSFDAGSARVVYEF